MSSHHTRVLQQVQSLTTTTNDVAARMRIWDTEILPQLMRSSSTLMQQLPTPPPTIAADSQPEQRLSSQPEEQYVEEEPQSGPSNPRSPQQDEDVNLSLEASPARPTEVRRDDDMADVTQQEEDGQQQHDNPHQVLPQQSEEAQVNVPQEQQVGVAVQGSPSSPQQDVNPAPALDQSRNEPALMERFRERSLASRSRNALQPFSR